MLTWLQVYQSHEPQAKCGQSPGRAATGTRGFLEESARLWGGRLHRAEVEIVVATAVIEISLVVKVFSHRSSSNSSNSSSNNGSISSGKSISNRIVAVVIEQQLKIHTQHLRAATVVSTSHTLTHSALPLAPLSTISPSHR